ncbi:MAG: branched-chain amino acid ABC transporter permease [Ktedonobacterales bacterium]|jgi:branched-chain amino acid transport system permease protein
MATTAQSQAPTAARGAPRAQRWRPYQIAFWLVCLAAVIAFPLVISDPAITTVAFFTLVFAAAGSAWNIFCGYTGYIALGHAVFFGTGCYALTIICARWHIAGGWAPFEFVPLAGLIAAVVAVPVGLVALRTRRHTFVVITIAIFFIFQLLAENNIFGLTNGMTGAELPIPPWSGYVYNLPFYYVILVILLLAVGTSWFVRHSKYGLELLAIRDDEGRALGLGVHTTRVKLSAFVLSAFFVGMCGAVWAYYVESVFPPFAFDALFDVLIALMAFLGGLGTISGPLLGALLLEPAQQYLTIAVGQNGLNLVVEGLVFLAVILLLPEGIVPAVSNRLFGRSAARSATPVAPGPAGPAGAPGSTEAQSPTTDPGSVMAER